MKTLGEMTPAERAALTQEQLDLIMSRAGAEPAFRRGGAYYVTVSALRAFEPRFAAPLQPTNPSSYEHLLTHGVLAGVP